MELVAKPREQTFSFSSWVKMKRLLSAHFLELGAHKTVTECANRSLGFDLTEQKVFVSLFRILFSAIPFRYEIFNMCSSTNIKEI